MVLCLTYAYVTKVLCFYAYYVFKNCVLLSYTKASPR